MTEEIFRNQAVRFLREALRISKSEGLELRPHWDIDHLCYRTASLEEYESLCRALLDFSNCLIESPVNGRLISTFKLFEPLFVEGWRVDLIEVPAPKPGRPAQSGFEHFEVVCDEPFEDLQTRFSHLKWDQRGLEKLWNQELEANFSNFAIKFHHLSLESVVTLESQSQVFSALMESRVLEKLKTLKPLIAGTFPLGIFTEASDFDILGSSSNLDEAETLIKDACHHHLNFELKRSLIKGQPSLICDFIFAGIKFEIFVQETPAVEQTGYRHFLIEERLLKWGGDSLREKVQNARREGLKTEPAFGKALSLLSDPYEELLDLQKKSHSTLAETLRRSN